MTPDHVSVISNDGRLNHESMSKLPIYTEVIVFIARNFTLIRHNIYTSAILIFDSKCAR